MIKTINFRPLRRVKKTGKIVVASYMQWRKVKLADYNKFNLIIDPEYKILPKDEYIYNHKGENLFWRHYNPEEIPIVTSYELIDGEQFLPDNWRTDYEMYSAKGLDCDGVPAFSNYTANDIVNSKADMTDFEPLTVKTVQYWFGWFMYKLNNAEKI